MLDDYKGKFTEEIFFTNIQVITKYFTIDFAMVVSWHFNGRFVGQIEKTTPKPHRETTCWCTLHA